MFELLFPKIKKTELKLSNRFILRFLEVLSSTCGFF